MPILTRLDYWTAQPNDLLASLAASRDGLTTAEARRRLVTEGRNSVAPPTGHRVLRRIAQRLAARRVVVKRLIAIHDLGTMDVLCTDKTGTLTEGRITLVGPRASTERTMRRCGNSRRWARWSCSTWSRRRP